MWDNRTLPSAPSLATPELGRFAENPTSMDQTNGIGTSAILQFGLALVDERTVSLEIGLNSSTQTGYRLATNT